MTDIKLHSDQQNLARAVAEKSIAIMRQAIADNGQCIWVLAGGSTPQLAYQVIADEHLDAVDWSRVTILIGDERIAPLDSDDSNWHQAEQALLHHIPEARLLRPRSDQTLDVAVNHYQQTVDSLPKGRSDAPHFDLVWLGVGEDGHTLSLFPGSPNLDNTTDLVLPVDDSPKAPAERLTLGSSALGDTANLLILASGHSKLSAITSALTNDALPIGQIARLAAKSDAKVEWHLDGQAAPGDSSGIGRYTYDLDTGYIHIGDITLSGLPESIDIESYTLLKKSEFHITIMGTPRMVEMITEMPSEVARQRLVDEFFDFVKDHDMRAATLTEDFRLVRHEDRISLVIMVNVPYVDELYDRLRASTGVDIPTQPAHITLYTLQPDKGIPIQSNAVLQTESVVVEVSSLLAVKFGKENTPSIG